MQKQNREIHSSLCVRSKNKDKKECLWNIIHLQLLVTDASMRAHPPSLSIMLINTVTLVTEYMIYALHISILVARIYLCIFVSHKNKTAEKLNNVIDQPLLLHWKKWLHHQPKICRNPSSNISIHHQHLGIQMLCLWIWVHSIRCYDWTVQAGNIWHYQKP